MAHEDRGVAERFFQEAAEQADPRKDMLIQALAQIIGAGFGAVSRAPEALRQTRLSEEEIQALEREIGVSGDIHTELAREERRVETGDVVDPIAELLGNLLAQAQERLGVGGGPGPEPAPAGIGPELITGPTRGRAPSGTVEETRIPPFSVGQFSFTEAEIVEAMEGVTQEEIMAIMSPAREAAVASMSPAAQERMLENERRRMAEKKLSGDLLRRLPSGAQHFGLGEEPQEAVDPTQDFLDQLRDIFGGGGGGGGVRREYQAPDRGQVRDTVRSLVVALLGESDDALIEEGVNIYLDADRRKVLNREAIDPLQRVKERVRGTGRYANRHRLRPDSIPEEEWIQAQQRQVMRAGVPTARIDELGIRLATVGVNPAQAGSAVQLGELQETGRPLGDLRDRMQRVAQSIRRTVNT